MSSCTHRAICVREGFKRIEESALTHIASIGNGDIRSMVTTDTHRNSGFRFRVSV